MTTLYPVGPKKVPSKLTAPTATYKRHAWLAVAALLLFLLLYVALAGWFSWKAWRLMVQGTSSGSDPVVSFFVGLCSAFLAFFMIKGLFFINKGGEPEDIEVKATDEPKLFEFLNQLADEVGAPRPHRVFLSPRVNAAVFYDLSLLNLIFPSKKNLEIGLPLINFLTLGELKAVLAHEFGHFAQRSMAVGRWVYVSQQIAAYLIGKRDGIDKFLNTFGSFHLAFTAVAWVLNLIIWSIRALIDSVFQLVVIAQRALSREMELQADLVSVSVTGSDALINALYRTAAAEECWDRAIDFANKQLAEQGGGEEGKEGKQGKAVEDLFSVQTRMLEILRKLRMEPDYGQLPQAVEQPDQQRIFKAEIAQPSRMWSTHPLNHEREANAKKIYIAAPLDDRPSWLVFADPAVLRKKLSAHLIRHMEKKPEVQSTALSLVALNLEYDRAYYQARYRGVYLGRNCAQGAATAEQLVEANLPQTPRFDQLYPESLTTQLQHWRELEKDKAHLEAIQSGQASAQGGVLRYHGQEINRKQLPKLILQLEQDIAKADQLLQQHDKLCRSQHVAAARQLGQGWEPYLRSLGAVLHYSEHVLVDMLDLQGLLSNIVSVEVAAGPAGKDGAKRIIEAAHQLHRAMTVISDQRQSLKLQESLADRLPKKSWDATLGAFDLPAPALENINDWIRAIDSWCRHFSNALNTLRQHTLEQLLLGEDRVQALWASRGQGSDTPVAPAAHSVPADYATLLPGQERKRQTKLGLWARFQRADGPVATVARFGVAASVVGAVVGMGGTVGHASLTIYNGLARPVMVKVNGRQIELAASSKEEIEVDLDENLSISALTRNGSLIEQFTERPQSGRHQIYNVASASPMMEWTAVYGNATAGSPRYLGAPRWFASSADAVFTDPPKSISTKGGGGTRSVLSAADADSPGKVLDFLSQAGTATVAKLVATHAKWDDAKGAQTMSWLYLAGQQAGFDEVLNARLKENPFEMLALRMQQDRPGADRNAVCAKHSELAAANPQQVDLKYLATRCIKDSRERDKAFAAGYQANPQHPWFAYANGYTLSGEQAWEPAQKAWKVAMSEPSLRDHLSGDLARIRRLISADDKVDVSDLAANSEMLRNYISLESGRDIPEQNPLRAYNDLAQGRLSAALNKASGDPKLRDDILRMVALSDGAEPQWLASAKRLPSGKDDKDISPRKLILEIAVLLKAGGPVDINAYNRAFDNYSPEQKALLQQFIVGLQQPQPDVQALEQGLTGAFTDARGMAYWLGYVSLGSRAPAHWAQQAKRLLFVVERAYIRS